jgi:chromosomal replication initiator protein
MDDTDVVAALRVRLADKIGHDRFELWFGPNVRLVLGQSTLAVHVPNQFHQNWLRRNFRRDLEAVCQDVLGHGREIEFRIESALDGKPPTQRSQIDDPQRQFAFDDEVASGSWESASATLLLSRPSKPPINDLPAPKASLGRKYATLESFVVGPTNKLAFAAAEMAAERSGSVNPLFIHGPTGVGKTHLLEGVLSEVRRLHSNVNAIFLTAEQFTTYFLDALHRSGLPSFRHKYRAVDLLIVDDLQFFEGKSATLVEFAITVDTLVRHGKQVVVAADRPLAVLTKDCPQLTHLSGGMAAKLSAADHATRLEILRRRAAALGLQLDEDVLQLVATQLTSHARELIGALNQLLAASRIRREPITKVIAEEALAELIVHNARPLQLQQIETAVCEVFGLNQESLHESRRAKALNAPRMVAMWLARKHTRAALSDIGRYFGRRSHSTVISAQKAVGQWVADQKELQISDSTCKAEDVIRRVEARLRAG